MTGPFSSRPQPGTVLAAALVISGLLTGMTTLAIAGPTRVAPGIRVFGGRSPARSGSSEAPKLDATLSGIVRGLPQVHASRGLTDLHNLNPAVRFRASLLTGEPLVLVDAIAHGSPRDLLRALQELGLEHPAVYSNDIGGWLPVRQLNTAAARPELHALRASMMHTHAGLVSSQGDFAQGSDAVRASHSLTGSGVTVGVLSDSFNCYAVYEQANSGVTEMGSNGYNGYAPNGFTASAATDESSGDLTTSVNVVEEEDCLSYGAPDELPFGDEGRALLQIVHDVAPGAALAFYTGDNSEADFASGVGKLQAAGARVIADDVGYYDEPFFQDGIVAQAIDSAQSAGVAYFAAAGNNGTVSYDNTAPAFTTTTNALSTAGEMLLNFDTTGASNTTALSITVPSLNPGDFFALVLQWDQPYVTGAPKSGGATSQLELCVTGAAASPIIIGSTASSPGATSCTGLNTPGADPVQLLVIGNPANASGPSTAETIALEIGLGQGSAAPGRIKLAVDGDGLAIAINNGFVPASVPTLQGHPSATGAMAIGAAPFWNTPNCGVSPAVLEPYSSRGGEPILFDAGGNRLGTAEQRTKPDVVDTDGVYTTFFGTVISQTGFKDKSAVPECADTDSFPSFFGTSAATPHAAAAAALFLQYNASLAPAQIYQALRSTASAMGSTVPNDTSGYGLVQAEQALAALPAPGSAGSSSSSGGSGSSSGSSSSGSSSSGSSSSGSSSSGSSHGGGSFDWLSLLVLAVLSASWITGAARRSRPAPPRA